MVLKSRVVAIPISEMPLILPEMLDWILARMQVYAPIQYVIFLINFEVDLHVE